MKNNKLRSAGFTLIEIALVLVIGGLLITAASVMLHNYLLSSRMALTQTRMQDIDNALQQYLSINGSLPCPAKLTDAPGAANFGHSITDVVATGCFATSDGASTFKFGGNAPPNALSANFNVVVGGVPTASLNLPDVEMNDAWGDRITYAVSDYLTNPTTYNGTQGSIYLVDGSIPAHALVGPLVNPANTPPYAQYVIISYGANRAGAFTADGKQGVACPLSPALENANCNFTAPVAFRKTVLTSTQTGNAYFDDYVTFHAQNSLSAISSSGMPSGMVAPFAASTAGVPLAACPNGWTKYTGATSCTAPTVPALGLCCQKQ